MQKQLPVGGIVSGKAVRSAGRAFFATAFFFARFADFGAAFFGAAFLPAFFGAAFFDFAMINFYGNGLKCIKARASGSSKISAILNTSGLLPPK